MAQPKSTDKGDNPVVADPQRATASQEGWEVGNSAPEDRYAPLKDSGEVDLDKVSSTPPDGGYGRQLVVKGDTVTAVMRQQLGMDE